MAHASYHPETGIRPVEHWFAWIGAVLGMLAAGIGLWYAIGPADGTIRIFGWTASLAEAATWVAPTLLIGGGGLTLATMGVETVRDRMAGERVVSIAEAMVAALGVAAIVIGIVVLL